MIAMWVRDTSWLEGYAEGERTVISTPSSARMRAAYVAASSSVACRREESVICRSGLWVHPEMSPSIPRSPGEGAGDAAEAGCGDRAGKGGALGDDARARRARGAGAGVREEERER